jgi:glutaredoxin
VPDQPAILTVYTAANCSLCETAAATLHRLQEELDFQVEWIAIDGHPELEAQWRTELPAGVLAGRKVFKYHVDEQLLRRRLPARSQDAGR